MVRKTKNTVFIHPKDPKASKTKTPPPPAQRVMFPVIRMAAAMGIGILDKYYSKTDDSIMYRVAMCTSLDFFKFPFTSNLFLSDAPIVRPLLLRPNGMAERLERYCGCSCP